MLRNFRRATSSSSSQTDVAFKDVVEGQREEDSRDDMDEGHSSPSVIQPTPKSSPESTTRMGALGLMMGHATRRRGQPKTSPQPSTSRNPKKLNKSKSEPSPDLSSAKSNGKKRSSSGPSGEI